jgi:ribokinase
LTEIDLTTVGHVLLDIRMLVERFPGPDEEAVILDQRRGVGGSAANTAIAGARLGLRTAVIAKIGLDQFARIVVDELLREKVNVSGIRISLTSPTGFSIVVRDKAGQIIIYGFKGAAEELQPNELNIDLIAKAKAIHIASLRLDTSRRAACEAHSRGKLVSWDPGRVLAGLGLGKVSDILECVDIALVNRIEARMLTGSDDYRRAARLILERGPRIVIVKLGSQGAYMLTESLEVSEPAYPVEKVVDTTGAGDTFAAAFLAAYLWGWNPRQALQLASMAAALKVARLGSYAAPTLNELIKYADRIGVKLPWPKTL